MPEDIKSKITKKILRKLAVRGLIALATGGTGWLVFEGIELAVDAITAAQTIAQVIESTEIATTAIELAEVTEAATSAAAVAESPEMAEIATELAKLVENTEIPETPIEPGIEPDIIELPDDWYEYLPMNSIVPLLSINFYWNKYNDNFTKKAKNIIQKNQKKEIKIIQNLKQKLHKTANIKHRESITQEIKSKIDDFSQNLSNDKKILSLVLTTYLAIQGPLMIDIMAEIENKKPEIIPALNQKPELIGEALSNNEDLQKEFQNLQQNLHYKLSEGISNASKESILEEIKNSPAEFYFSEIGMTFECKGKNETNIVVRAFKNPAEDILYLEGRNYEAVETPIKGINLENYPDSLISDIFQMCRYFREHDIFGNIRDLQAYNDYRKKVLGGWRSFKNV
ncbi:MAG: hypothetical protein F6K22_25020 [Okeania sp. SIO2F4]|uniref:hypothetical protein n=1 Tax=Okeania sp. SIO2F4 TaxID=2607790 RepID=UPI001429FE28|nr:hypothetical protein [Okeania sp. SIO2F4]NES05785.1 hypothetical protein [Okeania sp. SIO2F4]